MNYYCADVGGHELSFYGFDDDEGIRVVARWIRLFWNRYVASLQSDFPGSMALAIAREGRVSLWASKIDRGVVSDGRRRIFYDRPVDKV